MEVEAPSYIGVKVTWVAWLRRTLDPDTSPADPIPVCGGYCLPWTSTSISLVVIAIARSQTEGYERVRYQREVHSRWNPDRHWRIRFRHLGLGCTRFHGGPRRLRRTDACPR